MLSSFVSAVAARPARPASGCAPIPPERASEPAGYGALADFSPLHLLQLDACTKCGRCHEACPANATGRPLSPRDVILELREQADTRQAPSGIGGLLGRCSHGRADGDGFAASVIGDDGVRAETVWSCMQCNACVEICPVGIEQAPIINQLRRRLVEEGELDPKLQSTLEVIHKSGNSFGENKRKRGRWTERARLRGPGRPQAAGRRALVRRRLRLVRPALAAGDPRRSRGCSTRPASTSGSSTTASATRATTCAASARRGCSSRSPSRTSRRSRGCEFQRIVTTDPHSLNTLRNEYPELGGELDACIHHTALLLELIESGRLDAGRRLLGYRVTYHDPCHLGRLQRRVRRAAADPRAARLHAGRDAAQPRQLVLLRRRRRPDLDRRPAAARSGRPRTGSARRSALARRRAVRRRLPQGRDDVRGRDQDLGQRRARSSCAS